MDLKMGDISKDYRLDLEGAEIRRKVHKIFDFNKLFASFFKCNSLSPFTITTNW